MSTVPSRTIISTFSKAATTKPAFQSPLQQLTNRHQQHLQTTNQQAEKQLGYLTDKKQKIDRAIPVAKQPIQTNLKRVSNYYGNQASMLKAKINGEIKK